MEFINRMQEYINQSEVYQQFLKNMPPPLNNIYFDTLCVIVAVCYLIYRIVDGLRITGYHKRIRARQAEEQAKRREAERELDERETVVRDKEERINRFLDVCEFYFTNRAYRDAGGEGRQTKGFFARLGRKNNFLMDKGGSETSESCGEVLSDYEAQMREVEEKEKQEEEFSERRRIEREKVDESLNILNAQMKAEADAPVSEDGNAEPRKDPRFEKRRARALKQIEREQEKERKKAEKQRKREADHGAAGKN